MKDYFDDAQRAIARMLEERRELARLFEQANPVRQFQEAAEQARDWATRFQLAQTALLDTGRSLQFHSVESSLGREALNLASRLEGEFADRRLQLAAFDALHRPAIDAALESVLRQQADLAKLTVGLKLQYETMVAPAMQVQSALAALEASARLYSAPEAYWSNALAVVASYEQFAIRQTKRLASDPEGVAPRRARVTELAGALLVSSLGATDAVAGEPQSEAPRVPTVKPRIFGPLNSHLGFVYRASVEVDVDLAVAGALPSKICHLGGAIIGTVVRVNEVFRRTGRRDVFSPTNRSLWAASVIPAVVVGNELDFAAVIDALFFLLYEGSAAGSKNARFTPLLTDDELQPLWRVKHLRLNYRHDIEHGDDKDIARKHQNVGAAFVALIGKHAPTRPADWTAAQAELYGQLLAMLQKAEVAAQASGPTA